MEKATALRYSSLEITEMAAKAAKMVDIKDRQRKSSLFKQCFIGREFCKWFIVNGVMAQESHCQFSMQRT